MARAAREAIFSTSRRTRRRGHREVIEGPSGVFDEAENGSTEEGDLVWCSAKGVSTCMWRISHPD